MGWGLLAWPVRAAAERDGVCAAHSVYPGGHGGCPRCGAGTVTVDSSTPVSIDVAGEGTVRWWDSQAAAWERITTTTDPAHRTAAADLAAEARATAALYRAGQVPRHQVPRHQASQHQAADRTTSADALDVEVTADERDVREAPTADRPAQDIAAEEVDDDADEWSWP